MRTAPAVHVSVTRFGVWRLGVLATLVLVWSVLAAWAVAHWRAQGSVTTVLIVAAIAVVMSTAFASQLLGTHAFSLRWDGRCWHLSTSTTPSDDAVPGEIHATIDCGNWLLLRFEPERGGASRWLPVQRRGLESSWHSLRCAVYSPRVASGEFGARMG